MRRNQKEPRPLIAGGTAKQSFRLPRKAGFDKRLVRPLPFMRGMLLKGIGRSIPYFLNRVVFELGLSWEMLQNNIDCLDLRINGDFETDDPVGTSFIDYHMETETGNYYVVLYGTFLLNQKRGRLKPQVVIDATWFQGRTFFGIKLVTRRGAVTAIWHHY